MRALYGVLSLVTAQRLGELAWSARNTTRLRRRGAAELDAGGYRLFVLLHAGWLIGLALCVPAARVPRWPLILLYALLQPGRIWVMRSLGPFWTTRILTLPGGPLVRTGPYRWLRHPNYALVAAEIALLPLGFGAIEIAVICSTLNLAMIARRIAIEERALAPRRGR